jgi:hypothetical protein
MNFAKRTLYLVPLILLSCGPDLTEREKLFVGAWRHSINTSMSPDSTFGYLELTEDRKGKVSIVSNIHGRLQHVRGLDYHVTSWSLRSDTLIVDYQMTGGTFSSPGRKDTTVNDFSVTDRWLIKEIADQGFVGESIDPDLPFTSTKSFSRTEKIE